MRVMTFRLGYSVLRYVAAMTRSLSVWLACQHGMSLEPVRIPLQINLPGVAALAAPAVHGVRYGEGLYVLASTLRAFHASVILLCWSLSIVVYSATDHNPRPWQTLGLPLALRRIPLCSKAPPETPDAHRLSQSQSQTPTNALISRSSCIMWL